MCGEIDLIFAFIGNARIIRFQRGRLRSGVNYCNAQRIRVNASAMSQEQRWRRLFVLFFSGGLLLLLVLLILSIAAFLSLRQGRKDQEH